MHTIVHINSAVLFTYSQIQITEIVMTILKSC